MDAYLSVVDGRIQLAGVDDTTIERAVVEAARRKGEARETAVSNLSPRVRREKDEGEKSSVWRWWLEDNEVEQWKMGRLER